MTITHPTNTPSYKEGHPMNKHITLLVNEYLDTAYPFTGPRPYRKDLFVNEDKIVFSDTMLLGFVRNGDHWTRQIATMKVVFSFRNGDFNIYRLIKDAGDRKWQVRNITLDLEQANWTKRGFMPMHYQAIHEELATMAERFGYHLDLEKAKLDFPKAVREMAAPIFRTIEFRVGVIGRNYKTWKNAQNVQDLVTGIYGTYTKAHFKDFVQKTEGNDNVEEYDPFAPIDVLRGMVPHEWLDGLHMQVAGNVTTMRKFLRRFTIKKRLDFVTNQQENYYKCDILRMVDHLTKHGVKIPELPRRQFNWKDIHDALLPLLGLIEVKGKKISQIEIAKEIDGLKMEGHHIVTAKTTGQVIEWGNQQHHCIGSYVNEAVGGSCVLFGVYRNDGALIANGYMGSEDLGGVKTWSIVQLLGKHNQPIDADLYMAIESTLVRETTTSMQTNSYAWGRPRVARPINDVDEPW